MKVLFCTDGSDASFYAVKRTLPFLHRDDQIDVISVIDWGFLPTYVTFPQEEEVAYPDQKNVTQQILDKTVDIIESQGFNVSNANYMSGQPARVILDTIKSEGYELAVLDSHGKKGIRRWLGSVSRTVVSKSGIPTLIVRPPEKKEGEVIGGSKNILFAVDGSEYSYNAIQKTFSLLNIENASVEILTIKAGVEELPVEITSDKAWTQECIAKQNELATEILEKAQLILKEHNVHVKSAFSMEGDAAEAILNYTDEHKQDLIIMGSHGREGLSDFLLGSVSKRVLDNATSPVLIVPTKTRTIHK